MPDVRSKLPVLPVCRVEGRARRRVPSGPVTSSQGMPYRGLESSLVSDC